MRRFTLILMSLANLFLSGCTNMFFIPMQQQVRTPADIGLEYRDIDFQSSDGTPLHGWFLPARGETHGTVLFLHGNAENISTHIGSVYWLPAEGYNVMLFDYRGYGKSGGVPEIDGVIRDAESALEYAVKSPQIQDKPLIVYGQSIGGALAIYAVAHSPYRDRVNAMVIESAFASYRLIAREKLAAFWLTWPFQYPLSWTFTDRYKPLEAVPLISPIPLLLAYSDEDLIVPSSHGRLLFDAAKEPKQLWLMPNGRHISVFRTDEQRLRLLNYLKQMTP